MHVDVQNQDFSVNTAGSLKSNTPFSSLYLRSRARRQEGHLNELRVAFTACERKCTASILPHCWGMWMAGLQNHGRVLIS